MMVMILLEQLWLICKSKAGTIFNRLIKRDLVAWTVIIASYAQDGQGEQAMKCEVINSYARRICEAQ